MNINKLYLKCAHFEKIADLTQTVNKFKTAIQAEVNGGINSINKLVTSNKEAANSAGISKLDQVFGEIGNEAAKLSAEAFEINIKDILSICGKGIFYTLPQNAGMGYDPVTRIGGANSPASYLDRIYNHAKNLQKYVQSNT
jgi:hypothetical protein